MRKLLWEMISDLKKCSCAFNFMHFMVRALCKVQNPFRKQFSHKVPYNYYSIFILFWSVLVRIEKVIKRRIFHGISKNGFHRRMGIFSHLSATTW